MEATMPRTPTPSAPREHPRDRFRGSERVIDLASATQELRAGAAPSTSGHRQIALHRRGPTTIVLFAFDPGGELKEHRVDGLICVHVLRGSVEVHTPTESHVLQGGQMLMLDPGVPHDVRAAVASEMLLTIQLERGAGASHPG